MDSRFRGNDRDAQGSRNFYPAAGFKAV